MSSVAAALVDMKLHLAGDTCIDADAFEKAALVELGLSSPRMPIERSADGIPGSKRS